MVNKNAFVKVWDPLVRIFHWSLVLGFTVAYITGEDESALHAWSGYIVLGLVLLRLLWGAFGPQHARFRDFIYRPSEVVEHAREIWRGHPRRYLGHSPLGGIMVVLLLASLVGVTVTGVIAYGEEGHGPLAGIMAARYSANQGESERHENVSSEHQEESEEVFEEIHEILSNLALVLVFFHIAGVFLAIFQHRENLVLAMFTGKKRADSNPAG